MNRFENLDALAKAFVRAYFTTNVYQMRNLGKFYAPDATIGRGGRNFRFDADPGSKEIPHTLPNDSALTVVQYTPINAGDGVTLNVVGLVETSASKSPFTQTFVLAEADERLWIKADFLTVADDHLFGRIDDEHFFTVANPRPSARKGGAPRAERPKPADAKPAEAKPEAAKPAPSPRRPPPAPPQEKAAPAPAPPPAEPAKAPPPDARRPGSRGGRGRGRGKFDRNDSRFVWSPDSS